MKFIKKFKEHSVDYENYINSENKILPNLSYCEDKNDVHLNESPYILTIKEFCEYIYTFKQQLASKYFNYIKQYNITDYTEIKSYNNSCLVKLVRQQQQLKQERNIIFRNNMVDNPCLFEFAYKENNNYIIEIYSNNAYFIQNLQINYDENLYYQCAVYLYKTDEVYNGYDVFYIINYEPFQGTIDDDGTIYTFIDNYFKNKEIVILSQHDTFENFIIAYSDGNDGYTFTKPSSLTLTLTLIDGTLSLYDGLYIIYNHSSDETINNRLDNLLNIFKSNIKNFIIGDFSVLSEIDDIKIQVPRYTYKIITNFWSYFKEEEIFSL